VSLEQRIARLDAVRQVQNVMGRYSFWHTANMHAECADLFALKTPGTRAEMMWGVYSGAGGIRRLYEGWHRALGPEADVGAMHMHTLTTPVIEVAGDGQTARAVWVSPGHETIDGHANWAWCKYACDFTVEDGEWKIWHLHVYGIFFTPYDQPWTAPGDDAAVVDPPFTPPELAADRPPTTRWMYTPDAVYVNEPAPPAPYDTFDEGESY
jgi:ketosteroid isomerase-like protein